MPILNFGLQNLSLRRVAIPDWDEPICENTGTMKGIREAHLKIEKEEKLTARSRMKVSIRTTKESSTMGDFLSDYRTVCGTSFECTRTSTDAIAENHSENFFGDFNEALKSHEDNGDANSIENHSLSSPEVIVPVRLTAEPIPPRDTNRTATGASLEISSASKENGVIETGDHPVLAPNSTTC